MDFLPKPGLKPIKQVHLYTKWRACVPHPHKDEICPLPSNEIIRKVLKNRQPRKKKSTTTNNDKDTTASVANKKKPKAKEHETRTVTKDGVQVDVEPDEVLSDANDSNYEEDFDPLSVLDSFYEAPQTRKAGKTFLSPSPEAPTTKTQKVNRNKEVEEEKEKIKNDKRAINQKRMTTRRQRKLQQEREEPISKRLCRRTNYYNKHNTTLI